MRGALKTVYALRVVLMPVAFYSVFVGLAIAGHATKSVPRGMVMIIFSILTLPVQSLFRSASGGTIILLGALQWLLIGVALHFCVKPKKE